MLNYISCWAAWAQLSSADDSRRVSRLHVTKMLRQQRSVHASGSAVGCRIIWNDASSWELLFYVHHTGESLLGERRGGDESEWVDECVKQISKWCLIETRSFRSANIVLISIRSDTKVWTRRKDFDLDVSVPGLTAQQSPHCYRNLSTSLKLPSACGINDRHLYSDKQQPVQL